jgi:ADP-ribose pyrophosphatase YjhB (NUDIX family)
MKRSKRTRFTGRTATAIIIKKPDLILLIKRLTMPFSGYWALPGGKQDLGETVEETVIREAKEETGLDISIIKKIGEYREKGIHDNIYYDYSPACFLAKIIGGKIQKQENEISSIKFFSLKTIPKELAFEHNQMIEDYIKSL